MATTPRVQSGADDSLGRIDWDVIANVGKLEWALPVLTLAAFLDYVPGIGAFLAIIISIIGYMYLLMAFRGLGESALKRGPLYGRTFWVLISTIVLSIPIAVIESSALACNWLG